MLSGASSNSMQAGSPRKNIHINGWANNVFFIIDDVYRKQGLSIITKDSCTM